MTFNLPGFVWIVLILALIPPMQGIIEQFWPAADYYASAIVIALLGAVAKAIEVWARSTGQLPTEAAGPTPAASPAPMGQEQPSKTRRFLLG